MRAPSKRRQWYAAEPGVRFPGGENPEREAWDQQYMERLQEAFGGKDVELRPVKIPVAQAKPFNPIHRPERRDMYRRMFAAGDRVPPVFAERHPSDEGWWNILDGSHRWDAARLEHQKYIDGFEAVPVEKKKPKGKTAGAQPALMAKATPEEKHFKEAASYDYVAAPQTAMMKSPAFRHVDTGEVVESPIFHDPDLLPGGEAAYNTKKWEDGFVDHQGKFYNRQEAAAVVSNAAGRPSWLESQDYAEGHKNGVYKGEEAVLDVLKPHAVPLSDAGRPPFPTNGMMRAPAFRHVNSGQVVESPGFHNIEVLPAEMADDAWEDGFVGQNGQFYTRAEAAQAVQQPNTPPFARQPELESVWYGQGVRQGVYKAEPTPYPEPEDHRHLPNRLRAALAAVRRPGVLTDDMRKKQYRGDPHPTRGYCYVATEALAHLINGPKTGWQMKHVQHEGDNHFWLQHKATGAIMDPTWDQFKTPPPYEKGVASGPMHSAGWSAPSQKAKLVIDRARATLRKSEPLAKMALIHDDARRPTTVFRVENDDGEGPYDQSGMFMGGASPKPGLHLPEVYYENQPLPEDDFTPAENEQGLGEGHAFGFEHPHDAVRWFSSAGLRALSQNGYHLRAIPASKVIRSASGRQVMFYHHPSYKPGGEPIDPASYIPLASEMRKRLPKMKKSVQDLQPGTQLGQNPKTGEALFDYSHLLPAPTQSLYHMYARVQPRTKTLTLHVEDQGGNSAGMWTGNWRIGKNGIALQPHESIVDEQHRRRGLGLAMMEAAFTHARHHLGASQVHLSEHSTAMAGVLKKLSQRHGLGYRPQPNVGSMFFPDEEAWFDPDGVGDYDARYAGQTHLLKAPSATDENVAANMTPHKPMLMGKPETGYNQERIESYNLGRPEGVRPTGYPFVDEKPLYHHVYRDWTSSKSGYASHLHTISASADPADENMVLASSAMGVTPAENWWSDDWNTKRIGNLPWREGHIPVVGETATSPAFREAGIGTLLYRRMLQYHGRLASDSSTSAGADRLWARLIQQPGVNGVLAPGKGNAHYAEWTGEPNPKPEAVLERPAGLAKGAMQRLAPFDPAKDRLDERGESNLAMWQGPDREPEHRDAPDMPANARMRALHRLHASTAVRRNPETGEREFLLHRGVSPEEYVAATSGQNITHPDVVRGAIPSTGFVNHEDVSSWTPRYSLARGFGQEYMGTPLPGKPHVLSAWVPESSIGTIPEQMGALDREAEGAWDFNEDYKPPQGPNSYSGEHEVMVLGGHNSRLATPEEVRAVTDKNARPVGSREPAWMRHKPNGGSYGLVPNALKDPYATSFGKAEEKCPACGGTDIGIAIIGEPVYVCRKCDKKWDVPFQKSDREHAQALHQTGFWGRQGAGAVVYAQDTGRILLPHRSRDVQEPGTWGTWGGAIDAKEDPKTAAQREMREEMGYEGQADLRHIWTFQHPSGFQYHNFIAVVPHEFEPKLNWETQAHSWVEPGKWPHPLHPGLKTLLGRPEFGEHMTKLAGEKLGKTELDPYAARGASVLVENWKGEVLFGRRQKDSTWTLPGGHLETGEEPAAGAAREMYEECGLTADVMYAMGVANGETMPVYMFKAIANGVPNSDNDPDHEVAEWRWMDVRQGVPAEIMQHLAHPRNVVLRYLGWQEDAPTMTKAEVYGEDLTKMAVLHDDPKNPRVVYRFEDDEGRGPYQSKYGDKYMPDSPVTMAHRQPSPGADFDEKDLHDAGFLSGPKGQALAGFAKPEDAIEWFGAKRAGILHNDSVKLRAVPASKVWVSRSGRQVLFHAAGQRPYPVHDFKPHSRNTPYPWQPTLAPDQVHDRWYRGNIESLTPHFGRLSPEEQRRVQGFDDAFHAGDRKGFIDWARSVMPGAFPEPQMSKAEQPPFVPPAELPPEPGTAALKPGHIRLYHQTAAENLPGIRQSGILLANAKGIEGPRAIYASTEPFYGSARNRHTVEFQVPEGEFRKPFLMSPEKDGGRDLREKVDPSEFLAIHEPWHSHARYVEGNPQVLQAVLSGEYDDLEGTDPEYGPAIQYIKAKYGRKG